MQASYCYDGEENVTDQPPLEKALDGSDPSIWSIVQILRKRLDDRTNNWKT